MEAIDGILYAGPQLLGGDIPLGMQRSSASMATPLSISQRCIGVGMILSARCRRKRLQASAPWADGAIIGGSGEVTSPEQGYRIIDLTGALVVIQWRSPGCSDASPYRQGKCHPYTRLADMNSHDFLEILAIAP